MLWGDWRVCTFETLCLPLAKRRFFRKSTFNGLYDPFGSPCRGQKPSLSLRKAPPFSPSLSSIVFTPPSVPPVLGDRNLRSEGENRPTVLYLPHLSLPSGRVLNPLPSPRPFQKGKGCNRPPVLRTATLYGCRTIKGLRHVVRDGTAWGKVDRIIEVLVLW